MTEDRSSSNQEPYYYALWETHHGRGVVAQNRGLLEDAVIQYSIAAFVVSIDTLGMSRMCRAQSLVALANAYMLLERYDKALPLLEEALAARQDLVPECHPLTAETHHMMANAYRALKLYAEADRYYRLTSDCLHKLCSLDDPYLKQVVGNWLVNGAAWNATNDLATNDYTGGQLA
ncbi:MAG TPA: tetratricopeptide repeat protein [Candidatus Obscuribacterales bacterium]